MDKKLTEEQYEALTPFKDALRSAYKNSFVRISGSDFNKVAVIYNQIYAPLRKGQMGCNTCRLNALRKLGELYANYTEEKIEEQKKKKTGRPKKLTEEKIEDVQA